MHQVSFIVDREKLPAAEQALLDCGAVSVTLKDAGDNAILEPGVDEMPLWPETAVTGLFNAGTNTRRLQQELRCALEPSIAVKQIAFEKVPDKEWTNAWLERFRPMKFGQNLWVVPSAYQPPDPEAVNIRLDPGLAFGTGTHPSTALCLNWLDAHPPRGLRVIDYGCGSGLLAIAAAKLGADKTLAVDIDPQALTATRANTARNGLVVETLAPEGLSETRADLLIANILMGPLQELAPRFAEHVVAGGEIVLAGMLPEQAQQVSRDYARWFAMREPTVSEGWALLQGRRKNRPASDR